MTTFVTADIHGNYPAFKSVLHQANFNPHTDHLICLGDICDSHPQVYEVITLLLQIKNLTLIKGNHDDWTLKWMLTGIELPIWYHQGGIHTIMSYSNDYKTVPPTHIALLKSAIPYLILPPTNPSNCPSSKLPMIFVHGGFYPDIPITHNSLETLMWDRQLITYASKHPVPNYSRVFVGHTSTQSYTGNATASTPLFLNNLVMLDTGAGWDGPLTLMNIDTFEYYQSK